MWNLIHRCPPDPKEYTRYRGKDFNDHGVKANNVQSETDINEHDDAAEKVLDNHPGAALIFEIERLL